MNYEEYVKNQYAIQEEKKKIKKKYDDSIEKLASRYLSLKQKYINEHKPCVIGLGQIVEVTWFSKLGRVDQCSRFLCGEVKYLVEKESYYTEFTRFNGWKIDNVGNVVPNGCEKRSSDGDSIVSIKRFKKIYGSCGMCDYFVKNGEPCKISELKCNDYNSCCEFFYKIELKDKNV